MYAFAKNKLQELVAALNLPEVRVGNIPTILSAFDERVAEFLSQRREIKASLVRPAPSCPFGANGLEEAGRRDWLLLWLLLLCVLVFALSEKSRHDLVC